MFVGISAAAGMKTGSWPYRVETSSSLASTSATPVQPESLTSSLRYSSACSPMAEALTRIGRSLDTTVTSRPSLARFLATARIRLSLSPPRKPAGSTSAEMWFSSTMSVPPSWPSGMGRSSPPCSTRRSSRSRSALRAK